jgi:hypothetical protein
MAITVCSGTLQINCLGLGIIFVVLSCTIGWLVVTSSIESIWSILDSFLLFSKIGSDRVLPILAVIVIHSKTDVA